MYTHVQLRLEYAYGFDMILGYGEAPNFPGGNMVLLSPTLEITAVILNSAKLRSDGEGAILLLLLSCQIQLDFGIH